MTKNYGDKMKKQCDEKDVTEIEKIFNLMIPYRTLILNNKLEYMEDYVNILHKFNVSISKIEEKYKLINISIQFDMKSIIGEEAQSQIPVYEDSKIFFENLKFLNAYNAIIKHWSINDKINFDYLLERITKYNIFVQDIFITNNDLKNIPKLYYIYKDNSVIIVRK